MKPLTMTVFLTALLSIFAADVQAQQFKADWSAVDVDTGFGFALNDGARLDHNAAGVNVGNLDIHVNFAWTGDSSVLAHEHIDRVEWTVQHSGFDHVASYTTHDPESNDGYWSMCRGKTGGTQTMPVFGPRPCRALQTEGSVTISARAIYDKESQDVEGSSTVSVVALVAEDSRAFRVVDTTPAVRERPRGAPSVPYCFGDRDKCNETVENAGLWKALTDLCRDGITLTLGNGAYIKCP